MRHEIMKPTFSSSPFLPSRSPNSSLSLSIKQPTAAAAPPQRRPSSYVHVSNSSSDSKPHHNLRIGDPEPPWLVHPPVAAPRNPSLGDAAPLIDFRAKASIVGIPFSLRLVQLKKKRMRSRRMQSPPADLGALGNAVRSLAYAMEEIQRLVVPSSNDDDVDGDNGGDNGGDTTRAGASADAADSVVWLFQKVFYTSPDLVVRLLVLVTDFLAASTKKQIPGAGLDDAPEAVDYRSWFDIGILDEKDVEESRCDVRFPDYKRRGMAYENMIKSGMTSSMILSNYAQLLFEYERDIDGADYFFRWAVMQEPADAEAMSRYALFLWQGQGDLEAAEEMFLEALQADPENSHHGSSYAWFLWNTGGLGTCYPLGDGGDDDADGEEL